MSSPRTQQACGSTARTEALRQQAMVVARDVNRPELPREIHEAILADTGEPAVLKRARAVDTLLRQATPVIRQGELIVGEQPFAGSPGMELLRERGVGIPKLGYLVPDFPMVLATGLEAVRRRAQERLATVGEGETGTRHFLEAVLIVLDAAMAYADAYADESERLAADEADPARKAELAEIARVCRKVPRHPADTLHEAIQAVWFVDMATYVEGGGPAFSLGRPDQVFIPYHDPSDAARARELVECFWIKVFAEGHAARRGVPTLALGGLKPDGTDGTNALTWLMLDVTQDLRLIYPSVAVRFHAGTPKRLYERSLELLAASMAFPEFLNDDVMVPGWTQNGVSLEDARDYSVVGCHEPTIPGRILNKPAAGPGYVSFASWLPQALGDAGSGSPKTYDELRQAYHDAMAKCIADRVVVQNEQDQRRADLVPQPFLSAVTADCIERGLDISEGGARYNFSGFQGIGLGTAVDSLAALRTLVFEQERFALADVLAAMQRDFEGDEPLRLALLNDAPKYGNDDDAADAIAVDLATDFCTEVKRHTTVRGGPFLPALWSVWLNTTMGKSTPATPDGRHAGKPIAHSAGPSLGTARQGPTAIVKSVTKLDFIHAANGSSLLIHLQPELLATQEQRDKLEALIRTYFARGGFQIHFDTASVEELEEAQKHPLDHGDLIVRRAGYSEYFVTLPEDEQRFIIDRLRHGL